MSPVEALRRGAAGVPPLLALEQVSHHFLLPRQRVFAPRPRVVALDDLSLAVEPGRSLGIVGESGSGKSTLARIAMALLAPSRGTVRLDGADLNRLAPAALRRLRRHFQMVFQDPYGSLDPRHPVGRVIAEPLAAAGSAGAAERREAVAAVLAEVGLRAADAQRYPHEFSGGQRQRIAIARALVTRPRLIVADEPVSALDVSVRAQVLNLLEDLQDSHGITYLLISHDLAVVDHVCDEVAVIWRGRIVEQGAPPVLFRWAAHPYTRALLDAVPRIGRPRARAARSGGTAPAAVAPTVSAGAPAGGAAAGGCAYAERCPHAVRRCHVEPPALRAIASGHAAACHLAEQVMRLPPAGGSG